MTETPAHMHTHTETHTHMHTHTFIQKPQTHKGLLRFHLIHSSILRTKAIILESLERVLRQRRRIVPHHLVNENFHVCHIYSRMNVCLHVCVYVCVCVCVYTCACSQAARENSALPLGKWKTSRVLYVFKCDDVCVCVRARVCVCVCVYVCVLRQQWRIVP